MRRRDFILAAGAFSVAGRHVLAARAGSVASATDPSFAVLVSDCHLNAGGKWHTTPQTAETVRSILAFDPLPSKVVVFGDVANMVGMKGDYAEAKRVFAPLEAAGIEVAWMMGNHDHRGPFSETFPDWAASSEVEGRIVHVVRMPSFDFVLMDSLDEVGGEGKANNHNGVIDERQLKWFDRFAATTRRPYFVCAHHDGRQMKSFARHTIKAGALMRGFLHGHRHSWMLDSLHDWQSGRLVRSVGLPSAAAWGDIGFVTAREKQGAVEFRLYQRDCFFPKPDVRRDAAWNTIKEENDGSSVTVALR